MSTIKTSATGTTYIYRAPTRAHQSAGRGHKQVAANAHTGGLWSTTDKPAYIQG